MELVRIARKDGEEFDCATWLHRAKELPKDEVERYLTGKETEPWEIIYFKLYKSQLPVVEQALETTAAPTSSARKTGSPSYTDPDSHTLYVGTSTPLTVSTSSNSNVGSQYRFIPDGGVPPTYNLFVLPFPFHWRWTDFSAGPRQEVPRNGGFGGDGGGFLANDPGGLVASTRVNAPAA